MWGFIHGRILSESMFQESTDSNEENVSGRGGLKSSPVREGQKSVHGKLLKIVMNELPVIWV